MQRVRELKELGDAGVAVKNFRDAYRAYSHALEQLQQTAKAKVLEDRLDLRKEDAGREDPARISDHLAVFQQEAEVLERNILSNRSLAYSNASRYAEALADAALLTKQWPLWPKSWLRSACAHEGQGSNVTAAHLYAHAWRLQSGELEGPKADCMRALWRVLARLSRPQLAEEVVKLTGIQTDESQVLAIPMMEQHDQDAEQQQLDAEQQLGGDRGRPSKAELDEAGFRLVCDLMELPGVASPSFLHRFLGWLLQGCMAAHERAAARAMLYLHMQRPRQAACAAAYAVGLAAGNAASEAVHRPEAGRLSHEAAVDQLAHAFHLHGRAMLLSATAFAVRPPDGGHGSSSTGGDTISKRGGCRAGSLAQQPHATICNVQWYRAALSSLFCAHLLCPSSRPYASAVASEDVLLLGGDVVRAAAAAAKAALAQLAKGDLDAAHVPSCAGPPLCGSLSRGVVQGGACAGEASTRTDLSSSSSSSSSSSGGCEAGQAVYANSNEGCAPCAVALKVQVRLPCRVLPAAARALLVAQVQALIPGALEAVHAWTPQAAISQQQQQQQQQPCPRFSTPRVVLSGVANGRCPGDAATVTLTVSAKVARRCMLQLMPHADQPHCTLTSGAGCSSPWQAGVDVVHAGLGACRELAQLVGGALCGTVWHLPALCAPAKEQRTGQCASSSSSSSSKSSSSGGSSSRCTSTSASSRAMQAAAPAAQGQHSDPQGPADAGRQLGVHSGSSPAGPLIPYDMPYASYRLVDAHGRSVERPRKHPFALSRVYYCPADVPAAEREVWYEPAGEGCRWRQTASEVIVIATKVPQGTAAKDLHVTFQTHTLEVALRRTNEVLLSGQLARGIVPSESTWDCGGGSGEDGCVLELAKMNLELYAQPWRHSEAMWPRLFTHHADVAWDDTHKDYTDLPPQIKAAHAKEEAKKEQETALLACEHRSLTAAEERDKARRSARDQQLQMLMRNQKE